MTDALVTAEGVRVHEAGHAIAAALLGLRVESVTVERAPGYVGQVVAAPRWCHPGAPLDYADCSPAELQACCIAALAGRAAQRAANLPITGDSRDLDQAWKYARLAVSSDPAAAYEVAAFVRDCDERAAGLMLGFFFATKDLANTLAYLPTIAGTEAERITRLHIGTQLTTTYDYARERAQEALALYLPADVAARLEPHGEEDQC